LGEDGEAISPNAWASSLALGSADSTEPLGGLESFGLLDDFNTAEQKLRAPVVPDTRSWRVGLCSTALTWNYVNSNA
jgi:hypothetical protein